jgi:DNA-binding transcriptional ArsR family regulator
MVQYVTIDRTLGAISQLAQPFGMSLTGMRKHVQILEEAKLVVSEKVGRTRHCRLGPERLDDAFDWIEFYRDRWERRLAGIEAYIEEQKGQRP